MGCDIHVYVEFRCKGSGLWNNFGGRINPGRHYGVFAKLAGVRDYGDDFTPVASSRGMPKDAAWESDYDNRLFIVSGDQGEDGTCTMNQAERWVAQGCSHYTDERKTHVTQPDWHSHSWATADELEMVINELKIQSFDHPEYIALLDVLRSFERQGYDSRIVFWFDN
jgi:hypothetical protein